ncbi:hypothetical protein GS399_05275 [Pedobacter sp. HMF7647]|uniref:Uncharacterized protein n=1 Tax=Hufsiella arboris TaxID=2695275 RepID=A0A7K1Y726_9SPHI|nr:hypothetical protein [Hufsiella arboris]MXV50376.1 hypothetical protein [Hufsiella arboris]
MKRIVLFMIACLWAGFAFCQSVTGPAGYKVINIGNNGGADFTRTLILLHEVYNGSLITFNNAVGTVTAFRGTPGAFNRTNIAYVSTSSAYNGTYGSVQSVSGDAPWKLKTCLYNGTKYLALDVPYALAHQNWGYQFAGWANSTALSLTSVNYWSNGQYINQDVLNNIEDFEPNLAEYHDVAVMNIGTDVVDPAYRLQVNGGIHAKSVKVDLLNWADYVFDPGYKLPSLQSLGDYVRANKHLPDVPDEKEVIKDGIDLGQLNKILLKKIEELTLYLIEKDKEIKGQGLLLEKQQEQINSLISRTSGSDVK